MAARRLGLDPKAAGDLRLTRTCRSCGGPHGKPQIAGAELSLSKTGGMVAVASGPSSSPVGIDIERIPDEVFPGFDDYVLAPTESVPHGGDAVRSRLELWVAKEAALKTTGHGLSIRPGELEVVRTGDQASPVTGGGVWVSSIEAPEHPELNGLSLASLSRFPYYAAALSCADRLPVTSLRLSELLTVEHR
ncbi:4'-phosphopantetheinyl transferase family protein [Brevibacterium zhoupengii]|uniref:4'-phosphopantetheinyl transferase family protein n=1 Tax=Brevibacterium zhoupengii TaxID=2898795 RepID=UPI001E366281|nr:4'-phosphopantetheinyl transferase superfamily protein [Brevibacterium zhoupengii]